MESDVEYLNIILQRLKVCKDDQPRFGQGASSGLNLNAFPALYLAAFFERNRTILQATVTEIMEILLTPHE